MKYKAFISYKHDEESRAHAVALEKALKNYAQPLFSFPTRIFRDELHLTPNLSLSSIIKKGLEESEFLLFLAEEKSASSEWCQQELDYWCNDLGRADKLILVHIGDKIALNSSTDTIDWENTNALPENLKPHLPNIPLYVDLSWAKSDRDRKLENLNYKNAIKPIAARFRDILPERFDNEELRVYRRNTRIRNGAIGILFLFLVVSVLSLFRATYFQGVAEDKTREALDSAQVALNQRKIAEDSTRSAQLQRNIARQQTAYALIQRDSAQLERNRAINEALNAKYQLYISQAKTYISQKDYIKAIRSLKVADSLAMIRRKVKNLRDAIDFNQHSVPVSFMNNENIQNAILSKKKDRVLVLSDEGPPRLWDSQGIMLGELDHERVIGATFDNEQELITTFSFDGTSKIWDWDRNLLAEYFHEDAIIGSLLADGQELVLTWSYDGTASLWDESGNKLSIMRHDSRVNGAQFNSSEDRVLTWSNDTAKFWDKQGKLLGEMDHMTIIEGAVIHEQKDLILTWSIDGVAKLWDAKGELLCKMEHDTSIEGAFFDNQQGRILTWSDDQYARLWNTKGKLLAFIKTDDRFWDVFLDEKQDNILFWSIFDRQLSLWQNEGSFLYWIDTLKSVD
jgi:WD40 repeat protein